MRNADVRDRIVVGNVGFPLIPTGLVMKALPSCYYLSDPDRSLKLTSRRYLNFVRRNFLGGAADAESAPDSDVYYGLRAKLAVDDDGVAGGMIQYLPIEHSFVDGSGLYIIHCIRVHSISRDVGTSRRGDEQGLACCRGGGCSPTRRNH